MVLKETLILFVLSIAGNNLCYGKIAIPKCCENQYHLINKKLCTNKYEKGSLDLTQIDVYSSDLKKTVGKFSDYFEFSPGFFNDETIKKTSSKCRNFYLLQNGTVLFFFPIGEEKFWEPRDPEDYCIENTNDRTGKVTITMYFKSPSPKEAPSFYKWGFLVSSIFLSLLLVVYFLLPELRTLGGMILMAYAVTLIMAYLCTFSIVIGENYSTLSCIVLTCLIVYFFLSSFCWLNVMSFDIWWTFKGFIRHRNIRSENFIFCMYCLYAWGLPLCLSIPLPILNAVDAKRLPNIIKPNIPLEGCFLGVKAKLVYMYIPMFIMILVNWMFFGMTVFKIWQVTRNIQQINGVAAQKTRFLVYLKLSVVMGLSWVLEIISHFQPNFAGWYVTDTYNIFIGLIIFAIFVCKKKVYRSLKKRFMATENINNSNVDSKSSCRSKNSTVSNTLTTGTGIDERSRNLDESP